jgi:hypothetical protein
MVNIGLKNNNKVSMYTWLVSVFKGLLRERKKITSVDQIIIQRLSMVAVRLSPDYRANA